MNLKIPSCEKPLRCRLQMYYISSVRSSRHISGKHLCEKAFSNFAQWLQYDFYFIVIFCCIMLQVPTTEFILLAYRQQYHLLKWISTINSISRKLIFSSSCTKYQCKIMTFYDTKSETQKYCCNQIFTHALFT